MSSEKFLEKYLEFLLEYLENTKKNVCIDERILDKYM